MLVNGQCAAFLGKANSTFLLMNSRSLQGECRGRSAASTGSVLANTENDIAKILKIKSGNQYSKYMNHWKTPELTPDVYFFFAFKIQVDNRDDENSEPY